MYGQGIVTDYMRTHGVPSSVIGQLEVAPAGNLIFRVGKLTGMPGVGWTQTEHVVLSPEEALALVAEISEKMGLDK